MIINITETEAEMIQLNRDALERVKREINTIMTVALVARGYSALVVTNFDYKNRTLTIEDSPKKDG